MKLLLEQRAEKEIEVVVRYHEMDSRVKRLIQLFEKSNDSIYGDENGRQYKIYINDIYYIESVDKKTFIYTKDQVYRTEHKLYYFSEKLSDYGFVQVSKSCILNLDMLQNIKRLMNSRMEAALVNGEKVTVSRTYLPGIKLALSKEQAGGLS